MWIAGFKAHVNLTFYDLSSILQKSSKDWSANDIPLHIWNCPCFTTSTLLYIKFIFTQVHYWGWAQASPILGGSLRTFRMSRVWTVKTIKHDWQAIQILWMFHTYVLCTDCENDKIQLTSHMSNSEWNLTVHKNGE